jgi:hypothetical protein
VAFGNKNLQTKTLKTRITNTTITLEIWQADHLADVGHELSPAA